MLVKGVQDENITYKNAKFTSEAAIQLWAIKE